MRIERLDLVRFGRFEDVSLPVPAQTPDVSIIVGRNEAGKTTTMVAIEALLFGFPGQTSYAFRHSYDDLRVGAVLTADGESLAVRRRKGNRDTLLDDKDAPLARGDAALLRFLGGADVTLFRRMFSLSHGRLAEGGREIAAAEGEMGETLFAAGAALRGLRARRKGLDAEASELWKPRRAKTRRFYETSDRLAEVDRALNQTIRRPREWKSLKKEHDAARARRDELSGKYEEAATASRRASRIRRVLAGVRRKTRLDEEIAALGAPALLPEDAAERLKNADREAERALGEIGMLEQSLAAKTAEQDGILLDDAIHERRAAIRELEATRVKVAQMRLDLPKRLSELRVALDELRRAAEDLGWSAADDGALLERVPSARQIAAFNSLLEQRGALFEARKAAEAALADAERRLREQKLRVPPSGPSDGDAEHLRRILAVNAEAASLDHRIREARRDSDEAMESAARLTASLVPALPESSADSAALRALPVPDEDEVTRHRDQIRSVETQREELRRRAAEQRRELQADQRRLREARRDETAITRAELERARVDRDGTWKEVREALHRDASGKDVEVLDAERLADRFETLTRAADTVADRRFAGAETAGRIAGLESGIREKESLLDDLAAEEEGLAGEQQAALVAWRSLWEGCPFESLAPERMLTWLRVRADLLGALKTWTQRERETAALVSEAEEVRRQLREVLTGFGVVPAEIETDSLGVLFRRVEDLLRGKEEASRRAQDAREGFAQAESDRDRAKERLRDANGKADGWEAAWAGALADAGLESGASLASADAGVLAEMRDAANRARDLQTTRIERMDRDIAAFETAVRDLVSDLGPDLEADAPDAAALKLHGRLDADLARRRKWQELDKEIAKLAQAVAARKAERARLEANLAPLYEAAGVDERSALAAAIEESDRWCALVRERDAVLAELTEEGDGLDFEELRAECEGIGPDEARAREESAEANRAELQVQLNELGEKLGETRKDLEAFRGDDQAARLAAAREEALAAVRDTAERYTRVRSAEILLRWALERFRKEHQGPMLRRAGELFRTLTGGSFASLQVGFDSRDRLRLDAVRPDGEVVQMGGLSSGSEDQLYLALRVAAIGEYVQRAPALPFIADDLFLNFDEERAAAGFRVLGELARRTQVLFFTHHEHLVAIAADVLGEAARVIRLDERDHSEPSGDLMG